MQVKSNIRRQRGYLLLQDLTFGALQRSGIPVNINSLSINPGASLGAIGIKHGNDVQGNLRLPVCRQPV